MLILLFLCSLVDKKHLVFRDFCLCLRLVLWGFRANFLFLFAKIRKTIGISQFIGEKVQIVENHLSKSL